MTAQLRFPAYRLFPYEERLAVREAEGLRISVKERSREGLVIVAPEDDSALRRLTYAHRVDRLDGSSVVPDLAAAEAVHHRMRGRASVTRQATRYHVHGIHEYKGKFNPQVVRAFANVLGVNAGDWLIDPFAGSGTSTVEALSLGVNALGIDRSPIAVEIARAKTVAWLHPNPTELALALETWLGRLQHGLDEDARPSHARTTRWTDQDRDYLERWFQPRTLSELTLALELIDDLREEAARRLLRVAVSSIARAVSLQLPEDLRVRRRPSGFVAPPILAPLAKAVSAIIVGLRELAATQRTASNDVIASTVLGSASDVSSYSDLGLHAKHARRAIISSPPYATALPYIDTDRLSIVLLGLATATDLRKLELALVGSREWTRRDEEAWTGSAGLNTHALPASVAEICSRIRDLNGPTAGFRRRAVPGLLYRYFADMREAFEMAATQLRQHEDAIFIVGSNRTKAGGAWVTIETPQLLADVAEQVGFDVVEVMPLETWPRFGLHHQNGIGIESALWIRRADRLPSKATGESAAEPRQ